jgi:nicotinamide-nucleotide amidase
MYGKALIEDASRLLQEAREAKLKIATAESCTGGLVSALLTEIAGSSDVFERGFVVYTNQAKQQLLKVPADVLRAHGAVSAETARAMAAGALTASAADLSVAITGIAGPGGGSAGKPVGLVHFAAARRGGRMSHREVRFGDLGRSIVRIRSVETALELLRALMR